MLQKVSERKEAWKTIFIFLSIVTITSSLFHYAIVNLYPSSIYIGGLMWCPALAAILTLKLKRRSVSSLKWDWGNWKYIRLSYFVPALYVLITYYPDLDLRIGRVIKWANDFGLGQRTWFVGNRNLDSFICGNHCDCLVGNCWCYKGHGNHFGRGNRLARIFHL